MGQWSTSQCTLRDAPSYLLHLSSTRNYPRPEVFLEYFQINVTTGWALKLPAEKKSSFRSNISPAASKSLHFEIQIRFPSIHVPRSHAGTFHGRGGQGMISTTLPRVLHFAVNLERYLSPPYCFSRFYLEYLSNCRKVTSSIKPPQTRHKREERRGER